MLQFKFVDLHVENNWNFDIDFFQVLTCCNISNFGLIERCYWDN